MIELSSLRGRHQGRTVAVLGGGPSLLNDLRRVPEDAVLIGVNQHTLLLNLDYIVFQDRAVAEVLDGADAPKVTHHRDLCDIYSGIVPDFGLSGGTAVWIAEFFDAAEILICGCDNYTARRRYWHSMPDQRCPEIGTNAIDVWHQVRNHLRHPERVAAMSGPLTEVFKPYAR